MHGIPHQKRPGAQADFEWPNVIRIGTLLRKFAFYCLAPHSSSKSSIEHQNRFIGGSIAGSGGGGTRQDPIGRRRKKKLCLD